jgi:hypothetical protein
MRSEYLKALLNIQHECDLLKEIKDVIDECKMIRTVLLDQLAVLDSNCYQEFFPDLYTATGEEANGRKTFQSTADPGMFWEATQILLGSVHDFDLVESHASTVEKSVSCLVLKVPRHNQG